MPIQAATTASGRRGVAFLRGARAFFGKGMLNSTMEFVCKKKGCTRRSPSPGGATRAWRSRADGQGGGGRFQPSHHVLLLLDGTKLDDMLYAMRKIEALEKEDGRRHVRGRHARLANPARPSPVNPKEDALGEESDGLRPAQGQTDKLFDGATSIRSRRISRVARAKAPVPAPPRRAERLRKSAATRHAWCVYELKTLFKPAGGPLSRRCRTTTLLDSFEDCVIIASIDARDAQISKA